jgi:flagellin
MALSIANNIASLVAQTNLSKSSSALNTSLQRLSSGLKINTGADSPAGLVISNEQGAQIAGLQSAIDNTNQAVSLVQTGEGALSEVNDLLVQVRGLALSAANSGVSDSTALAADQAQIANALSTIDNIAGQTRFGNTFLLNGQSGVTANIDGANSGQLGQIKADIGAVSGASALTVGTHTVAITAGAGATVQAGAALASGTLAADGYLTINGGGLTQAVTVNVAKGDDYSAVLNKIQTALDNAAGAGKFTVSGSTGANLTIKSNILGSASNTTALSIQADSTSTTALTGVTSSGTGDTGSTATALAVTLDNGETGIVSAGTEGLNNKVSFGGSSGLSFAVGVTAGAVQTASTTTLSLNDNHLTFQTGANAGNIQGVSIDRVSTAALGTGLSGLKTSANSLSKIDVTVANGAQDALRIIDQAISEVSSLRGKLGAFQTNTLQATTANLQTALTNTTSAQSVIRDTDFAAETANFTKSQVLVQAGTTVLTNANATAQLILNLLK